MVMLTKSNPVRSKRLRDAAKGQPCTIRLPGVCDYNDETTVFCHFSYASSGMGTRPSDTSGAFGCARCHSVADGRTKRPHGLLREDIEWCKARGMAETWGRLVDMGVIQIKGGGMSEADYYRTAYKNAEKAIVTAMDILADMHDGEECKFSGGDGCLACIAQGALMEAGRGEDNRVKNG